MSVQPPPVQTPLLAPDGNVSQKNPRLSVPWAQFFNALYTKLVPQGNSATVSTGGTGTPLATDITNAALIQSIRGLTQWSGVIQFTAPAANADPNYAGWALSVAWENSSGTRDTSVGSSATNYEVLVTQGVDTGDVVTTSFQNWGLTSPSGNASYNIAAFVLRAFNSAQAWYQGAAQDCWQGNTATEFDVNPSQAPTTSPPGSPGVPAPQRPTSPPPTTPVTQNYASQNIITAGLFYNYETGTTTETGWAVYGSCSVSVATTVFDRGISLASAKLVVSATYPSGSQPILYQNNGGGVASTGAAFGGTIVPGQAFKLTAWLYGQSGNTYNPVVWVAFFNSSGTLLNAPGTSNVAFQVLPISASWQQVAISGTVPANAVGVQVALSTCLPNSVADWHSGDTYWLTAVDLTLTTSTPSVTADISSSSTTGTTTLSASNTNSAETTLGDNNFQLDAPGQWAPGTAWIHSGNATIISDSAAPGGQCCQLQLLDTYIAQLITVTPGQTFYASCNVKYNVTGGAALTFDVVWYNDDMVAVGSTSPVGTLTVGSTSSISSFELGPAAQMQAPSGATYAWVIIFVSYVGAVTDVWEISGCLFQQVMTQSTSGQTTSLQYGTVAGVPATALSSQSNTTTAAGIYAQQGIVLVDTAGDRVTANVTASGANVECLAAYGAGYGGGAGLEAYENNCEFYAISQVSPNYGLGGQQSGTERYFYIIDDNVEYPGVDYSGAVGSITIKGGIVTAVVS
jgi:hypothetical protein